MGTVYNKNEVALSQLTHLENFYYTLNMNILHENET